MRQEQYFCTANYDIISHNDALLFMPVYVEIVLGI